MKNIPIVAQCMFLILFGVMSTQCTEDNSENLNPSSISDFSEDTLKFTSGIRAILHDSKGNYWLGSHQEGLAKFDGESVTYFSTEDGLPSNQVRRIVEDESGVIWFGTAKGPCAMIDGELKQFPHETTFGWGNPVAKRIPNISDPWFNAGEINGFYSFDGEVIVSHDFPFDQL